MQNYYHVEFEVPRVVARLIDEGAFLAGSSVLRLWYNNDIIQSDWDLYVTPEVFERCSQFLPDHKYKHYLRSSEIPADVARYSVGGVELDINITEDPFEMIFNTDLDICKTCFGFNNKNRTVVYSFLTFGEHKNRVFRYTKSKISYLNARRIKKYTRYGYKSFDTKLHSIIEETHVKMISEELSNVEKVRKSCKDVEAIESYLVYESDLKQKLFALVG